MVNGIAKGIVKGDGEGDNPLKGKIRRRRTLPDSIVDRRIRIVGIFGGIATLIPIWV